MSLHELSFSSALGIAIIAASASAQAQQPPESSAPAPAEAEPTSKAPHSVPVAAPGATRSEMAPASSPVATSPEAPPASKAAGERKHEPLAGWSDGTLFLRSPDNLFQLFPNGRLHVDGYLFDRPTNKLPMDTFLVKRARLEMFGWIGPWFGFNIAGDFAAAPPAAQNPVAQSALNATDNFVVIAPFKDVVMLQAGQFDAPFTLENRTSDKYFDFIERSHTVRAFAIPANKDTGLMVHGILPSKVLYYSAGVFNGEGQNFKNADNSADFMGRAWFAPFALTEKNAFDNITIGGSAWMGKRGTKALPLAAQQTVGGFKFLDNGFDSSLPAPNKRLELHQRGDVRAFALELDAPIDHIAGVRGEYVHKEQNLAEVDATQSAAGKAPFAQGTGSIKGWSAYGQAWVWVMGDDTIVGRPGLQLPPRFEKFGTKEPRHGLQILARIERLEETVTGNPALGDTNAGKTTLTSLQVGGNYWYTKRFRGGFNYVLNKFGGDTAMVTKTVSGALDGGTTEHEFLFRMGIAL